MGGMLRECGGCPERSMGVNGRGVSSTWQGNTVFKISTLKEERNDVGFSLKQPIKWLEVEPQDGVRDMEREWLGSMFLQKLHVCGVCPSVA